MTISYENKFRDLVAFNFHNVIRSPITLVCWAAVLVLMCQLAYQASKAEQMLVRMIVVIVMATIVLLVFLTLYGLMSFVSMISRKNRTLLTQNTLTLTEEFLISESEYGRSETKWKAVQKLVRKRNYLFIYVAQYSALVIPRRAVPDPDWDIIHDFCVRKLAANKPSR